MRPLVHAIVLSLCFNILQVSAIPLLFQGGTGSPNPGPRDERSMWSEPPDLNGLIGSSEQILQFGLETEIANDFIPTEGFLTHATWWGGFYNNTAPCESGMSTTGFNLEFFEDAGCVPGNLIAYITVTDFGEEEVYCQGGFYPIYKYGASVSVPLLPGTRYWFCAQMRDHPFPPQWGRLASMRIVGCDSVFRSDYFSYPDWTPADDGFSPFDASQEFEGGLSSGPPGACCVEGICAEVSAAVCQAWGGIWLGEGSNCGSESCPFGACCRKDGSCDVAREEDCAPPNSWEGLGTYCQADICVTREPGAIASWGSNAYGQCDVPSPDRDFVALAAGGFHCLGLKAGGAIAAWGRNDYGQCNVPPPNAGYVGIAGGWGHSLGLEANGAIVAWGMHDYGQCTVPAPDTGFVAVAAGGYHSLGLLRNGSIVAWGWGDEGQCDVPTPNAGFIAIAAGGFHSIGLKADGSIVAWGKNNYEQCDVPAPDTGFVAIAAGWNHNLALRSNGSIVAWGRHSSGQCDVPAPNVGFISIAGGSQHSLGVRSNGMIEAWGSNANGECDVPLPNRGFVSVSAGGGYASFGRTAMDVGACCRSDGSCMLTSEAECAAADGTYHGAGTVCDPNPCVVSSARDGGASAGEPRIYATPNPGEGGILIRYEIPRITAADLAIYSATGTEVRRYPLGRVAAGRHAISWDGRDRNGRRAPVGVYWARITTSEGVATGRVVVLGW